MQKVTENFEDMGLNFDQTAQNIAETQKNDTPLAKEQATQESIDLEPKRNFLKKLKVIE